MSAGVEATALSAPVVAALEHAWAAIRARHPELPAAVVVLASGSVGAAPGTLRLGHFAAMRWHQADAQLDNGAPPAAARPEALPEVFVGGEGLARGPIDVLGTLLHEAAHALAFVRDVKDTSRQGRYHNRRYAALAAELGLHVTEAPGVGWSDTHMPPSTAAAYADVVDELRDALTIYRRSEGRLGDDPSSGDPDGDEDGKTIRGPSDGGRSGSNNGLACTCDCGRRIRVGRTVLAQGPIVCSLCDHEFTHPAGGVLESNDAAKAAATEGEPR